MPLSCGALHETDGGAAGQRASTVLVSESAGVNLLLVKANLLVSSPDDHSEANITLLSDEPSTRINSDNLETGVLNRVVIGNYGNHSNFCR
eukprot:2145641-Rhodomonas_salina.2